jgi:hypothetical protein
MLEKLTSSVVSAFSAGLLSREQALLELRDRGAEYGFFNKLNE